MFTRLHTRCGLPSAPTVAAIFAAALALAAVSAVGQTGPGTTLTTPTTPMELPVEVEIELSPAGSLKQAPLWKELEQLLRHPYGPDNLPNTADDGTIVRRPSFRFGVDPDGPGPLPAPQLPMDPLNVYPLDYNFLTGQPMRIRTSDGEISLDNPGPMFDPDEASVVIDPLFNTPTTLRTPIGALVGGNGRVLTDGEKDGTSPCTTCGYLVVYNPSDLDERAARGFAGTTASTLIPPGGTVVAVPAVINGTLRGRPNAPPGQRPVINQLETPINEVDFFRPANDLAGLPTIPARRNAIRPYLGRKAADVLGKALFWDMQVGSDNVQSCGSCHFHAGADNRTRNQLNPNHLGGDLTLQVAGPNADVVAANFPFRQLQNPNLPSEGDPAQVVLQDFNDVMSSMGVSRFRQFVDVPLGAGAFGPSVLGVRALLPDLNTELVPDPIPVFQGLRRVEPRHTPTFHNAAFNLDNFWDGRARFVFNGGSVFGASDPQGHIWIDRGQPGPDNQGLRMATNGRVNITRRARHRMDLEPEISSQPVRIKFSSLASQSVGPPLSEFEMSFFGRNWPKIGKKFLQGRNARPAAPGRPAVPALPFVTPLANQLVDITDSVLGPFSNQGGSVAIALGRPTAVGKPGLAVTYPELIRWAFNRHYWHNTRAHFNGAPAPCTGTDANGFPTPAGCDPFDGYVLKWANGPANRANTNQFTQMEANFSFFFGMAVQAYETLVISDDTPFDRFMDANPNAGQGIGEPGDQAVLFPTLIPDLLADGLLPGQPGDTGVPAFVNLIPDDPATPEFDGFGPDEVFGFDIFAGGNLTAALAPGQSVDPISGRDRNPVHTITRADLTTVDIQVGSNPFTRSAKCMLCHLGPEQTDASINIAHGLLKNNAEFEYPVPPRVADPLNIFADGLLPAPEPSGSSMVVGGLILSEEVVEGMPQDAVEVEPRNFATLDDPATPWDDRIISQPGNFAFGDQGIYNVGVRPIPEDIGRGGDDPFGWPLSLSALTLKNIGGVDFEPFDNPTDLDASPTMANFDPANIEGVDGAGIPIPGQQGFEETGDGASFPGAPGYTLQSINPGFERGPNEPQLPPYLAPWVNDLPAGELHPQIDEMAGMVPNTLTPPNGGPGIEFPEIMFGADLHCASYNPDVFGFGPPSFGWGPPSLTEGPSPCPQNQSGVTGNFAFPSQGTWPVPNRVLREGAFKAPGLRNVELTGPYFHTGSFLTLRQVVDFYFRGGDFPVSNAESRDPHMVDVNMSTFALGRTTGDDLRQPINFPAGNITSPTTPYLVGPLGFADGLPDTAFLYDEYPDSDHPVTPEPTFADPDGAGPLSARDAAIEDAKVSLVKFMLALTDQRVAYERAPFDRPEIFVPIDGTAPENTGGRAALVADAASATPLFRHLPALGAAGRPDRLPSFLNISRTPVDGPNNDHFDP